MSLGIPGHGDREFRAIVIAIPGWSWSGFRGRWSPIPGWSWSVDHDFRNGDHDDPGTFSTRTR